VNWGSGERVLRAQRALECDGPPRDGFAVANLTPLFVSKLYRGESLA
jgi:hypothetical protein